MANSCFFKKKRKFYIYSEFNCERSFLNRNQRSFLSCTTRSKFLVAAVYMDMTMQPEPLARPEAHFFGPAQARPGRAGRAWAAP